VWGYTYKEIIDNMYYYANLKSEANRVGSAEKEIVLKRYNFYEPRPSGYEPEHGSLEANAYLLVAIVMLVVIVRFVLVPVGKDIFNQLTTRTPSVASSQREMRTLLCQTIPSACPEGYHLEDGSYVSNDRQQMPTHGLPQY
jgi:hypothetical protein